MGNKEIFILLLTLIASSWSLSHSSVFDQINEIVVEEPIGCSVQVVESIPEGLIYNDTWQPNLSTFKAWQTLLDLTKEKLDLASSYWSLRGQDVYQHPSDWQGEWIFKELVKASQERNIAIRIAQNDQPNNDTEYLGQLDNIQVRALNFDSLMGAGILHTKLWISDSQHFYVGSANFDWRSLTQVKEIGVLVQNCPTLASDMSKIFEVYWMLGGQNKSIPDNWPEELETSMNRDSPLMLDDFSVFLSSSPPPFCPKGREVDIQALLSVINQAQEFIYVAVMDYSPSFLYSKTRMFWPEIDDAIRKAVIERGVEVKLLFSLWDHTKPDMYKYMASLKDLNGINGPIDTRLFQVPSFSPDQAEIPYARVNHNKYMVTEKNGYIGTSNWSADYFVNTGGIGFVFENMQVAESQLHSQLLHVFQRDWTSSYSLPLNQ